MFFNYPLFRKNFILFPLLLVTICSVGCSKKSATKESVEIASGEQAASLLSEGKNAEAAEKYARIGELLLLPEGIEYADEMFDKALEIDKNNAKANFYSSITKPILTLRGFIPRFSTIVEPNEKKRLESLRKEIEKLNLPEMTRFANHLPQGITPFETYHQVQRFLKVDVLPTLLDSINKLDIVSKQNNVELNVNLARLGVKRPNTNTSSSSSCNKYESSYYEYSYKSQRNELVKGTTWYCTYTVKTTTDEVDLFKADKIVLDGIDLKIVKGAVMAIADYIRLTTAYSYEGGELAIREIQKLHELKGKKKKNYTTKKVVDIIKKYSSLFTLEADQELSIISKSVDQVLRDAMDLGTLQSEICNNSDRNTGTNLVHSFCINVDALRNIQTTLELLAGPRQVDIGLDSELYPVITLIDLPALIGNPPKDLKSMLPTAYDRKGNPIKVGDSTFGGLSPEGDLFERMKLVKRKHRIRIPETN